MVSGTFYDPCNNRYDFSGGSGLQEITDSMITVTVPITDNGNGPVVGVGDGDGRGE